MEVFSFDVTLLWPSTVVDLIFQHLSAKEILSSTLVSTTWENFIGKSQTSMTKINLTIVGRKYFLNCRELELRNELKMLSQSPRRYENLMFYAQRPGCLLKDLSTLLKSRNGKWKSVKIWSEKFEDESQLEDILTIVDKNVENLDLRNISLMKTCQSSKVTKSFVFNKMKSLSLCNVVNPSWFLKGLNICNCLTSLEIENGYCEQLINFLEVNKTIKKLSITETYKMNDDFFDQLSKLDMIKLEEFKFKSSISQQSMTQIGLTNFLEMQADNITKMTFDAQLSVVVVQTICKFTKLKILQILTPSDYQENDLPINQSIIELKINFGKKYELLDDFITAMPNLKILRVSECNEKLENLSKLRLKYLETLEIF